MCNETTVIFDIKSLTFFPEVNGNFSCVNFKPAKNLLHEKLNRIHNFKMETYHLLLMTSVKTEILCISPLITITHANTRQKKIAKALVPLSVQKMLSTSEIKPLISATSTWIYTLSAALSWEILYFLSYEIQNILQSY